MEEHRFISKILVAGMLSLFFFSAFAQDEGRIRIYINASNQTNRAPVEGATVNVYSNGTLAQKQLTNKKGRAEIELAYGPSYRIVLSKEGLVSTYFLLNADIPKNKYLVNSGFDQVVYFVDKQQRDIDTLRFRHPFTKWTYDFKENHFMEDRAYLKEFEAGLFKEDLVAAQELAARQAKEKEARLAREKAEKEQAEAERKRREALIADYRKKVRIAGKVLTSGSNSKPIMKAKVALINAQGRTVETTHTNALGSFAFSRLSSEENFALEIEEVDSKYLLSSAKIALTSKDGRQLLTMGANAKGIFRFQFLQSDKNVIAELVVNDAELRVDIFGKILKDDKDKSPVPLLKINLRDSKGAFVRSVLTDKNGRFSFRNLPSEASYAFDMDANDPHLVSGDKLILENDSGRVIQELNKAARGGFNFEILPADQNSMTSLYADDPWLKVVDPSWPRDSGAAQTSLVIKEHIYFKSNDASIQPDAQGPLNEVISVLENVPDICIELSSHTDSKGSDDYNLQLSQRRAKAAVDYIVSHGIEARRISGKGYGETMLVNKCGNGVECSEEEHAQNRRLEFRVIRH